MTVTGRRTYALLLGEAAALDEGLASTIETLEALDAVDEIHVWVSGQDAEAVGGLASNNAWQKVAGVNSARATRDATIFEALTVIRPTASDQDLVVIADAEHRSLTEAAISSCLTVAAEQGAAILASRVAGEVILGSDFGKIGGLPREGGTFVAAGLLVTEFSRMFEPYDWASTVAKGSVDSPYRWSLSQLGAVVVPNDGAAGR